MLNTLATTLAMAYWESQVNFNIVVAFARTKKKKKEKCNLIDIELVVSFTPQAEVLDVMDFCKYIPVPINNILTFRTSH